MAATSSVDPLLLSLICAPQNLRKLDWREGWLIDEINHLSFPIFDGIPSFVAGQPVALRHRFWRLFYDGATFAYDTILRLGDHFELSSEESIRHELIGKLKLFAGARVLEVGTGTAANRLFLPRDCVYVGLDISMGMLKRAQKKMRERSLSAFFVHADAQALPFFSGSFDLVLCMGSLQHFSQPGIAAGEMMRVAKEGGSLLFLDELNSLPRSGWLPKSLRGQQREVLENTAGQLVSWRELSTADFSQIRDYYIVKFNKHISNQ